MAFTFTTLKTAIQDYTQNTESTFVSQLSRFIINSEERILKECQLDVFRRNDQGSLTSGNKYLTKPDKYLAPYSLSVITSSENNFLLYKHPTFLQDYTPNPATTGVPLYYAELALLYGSLVEAYTFMKGETDMLQLYQARFQESLNYLKNLGEGRTTRDEYRYDEVRREPIA